MELFKVCGRVFKIVLSVSVLSLVVSFLPFLFQSLNQFSINKCYVFLFCNGLMAFIYKNSSLPSDHSSSHQFNDLDVAAPVHNSQEHDMAAADSAEQQEEEEEKRIILAFTYSQEEDEVIADTEREEVKVEEEEKRIIVADNSQEEKEEGSNNGAWMTEEEEEEVEELNKKCEDFIRKMKSTFCSGPRYDHTSAMVTIVR
ncbi:hypothetical protein QN277_016852 [Acacia crassicarpa]|uniref:Uncharacterized protein n=1 Tax=Acacia crassicarpa TaxID=499986 RepID=A0AAE1MXJ4_9FABA|nr:hypothetical protein QN277_016852 [Acacia crassicarpa]